MKYKIITMCGSLKFKKEMIEEAIKKEVEGNIVLTPIFPVDDVTLTKEEKEMFGNMHKEKIKISDAILVMNVDGYIGKSTQEEIDLALSLNKDIIYYQ